MLGTLRRASLAQGRLKCRSRALAVRGAIREIPPPAGKNAGVRDDATLSEAVIREEEKRKPRLSAGAGTILNAVCEAISRITLAAAESSGIESIEWCSLGLRDEHVEREILRSA